MKSTLCLFGCLMMTALLLTTSAEVGQMSKLNSGGTEAKTTTLADDPNPADLLEYVETIYDNGAGNFLADTYAAILSPDGKHLYAVDYADDAIWLFNRHQATGALTFVERVSEGDIHGALTVDGLNGALDVAISPDGLNVYVLSYAESSVASFSRNAADGTLTFIDKETPGGSALYRGYHLTVSPDGQNIYATGYWYDTVVVFRRLGDGTLSVIQTIDDSSGSLYGIDYPRGVAVSNDGEHVFVASHGDNKLVVFKRDSDGTLGTSGLSIIEYEDGVDGADGLYGANGVYVSPDDNYVYVTGINEDALSTYQRDSNPASPAFGRLTFLDMKQRDINGVEAMDEPRNFCISPDGEYIYVAARFNDAVVSFSRDTADGQLSYIDHVLNGQGIDVGGASTPGADAIVATLDFDQFTTYVFQLTQEPLGNRAVGTAANYAAVDWIDAELASMGYAVERHAFTYNSSTYENVYATKVGTTRPNEMYIISAHLDHINNQGLANRGADDDASGTAAVLEAARVFALPGVETECSVRFVLWNAEEVGLVGSREYVTDRASLRGIENPPGSGLYPEPNWLGVAQLDMILYDHGYGILNPGEGPAYLGADMDMEYQRYSAYHTESLALAYALKAGSERFSSIYPAQIGSNMGSTDSVPFEDYCASVGLLENQVVEIRDRTLPQSNPIYHMAGDVFEYYTEDDYRYGFDYTKMVVGTIAALAKEEMEITIGDPLRGLASAYDIMVSPDGAHIYVTSTRDDAVVTFIMGWAEETYPGSNVAVTPLDKTTGETPATITFSNVTTDGVTSVETSTDGPAPPGGLWGGDPYSYFTLETTSGHTGNIQLQLDYNPAFVNEFTMNVYQYISSSWVEITGLSIDTNNHTVSFTVASLDPVGVFAGSPPAVDPVTGLIFSSIEVDSVGVSSLNTPNNLTVGSAGLNFANITQGTNSGWQQHNNPWISSGLSANTAYEFSGQSRDIYGTPIASPASTSVFTHIEAVSGLVFTNPSPYSITVASANMPSNLSSGLSGLLFNNQTTGATSDWQHNNDPWTSGGLSPNTPYNIGARSRNGDGELTAPAYQVIPTLATTPTAPTVTNPTLNSLTVSLGTGDGNPIWTEFALQVSPPVGGQSWVQNDGAIGAAAHWQTKTGWGAQVVSGLQEDTLYTFTVIARNSGSVETAASPGGSGSTHYSGSVTSVRKHWQLYK